jgi:hypothetical protein
VLPRALLAVAILIIAPACTRGNAATTSAPQPGEPTRVEPSVTPLPPVDPPPVAPPPVAPPPVDPPPVAPPPVDPPPVDTRVCAGVRLEDPVTVIVEDSSVRLSGVRVTARSIIMRWVKRDSGVAAHLTSASISTTADTTGTTVGVGTYVPIGADRYCVVGIVFGRSEPGSVSLQKVAP